MTGLDEHEIEAAGRLERAIVVFDRMRREAERARADGDRAAEVRARHTMTFCRDALAQALLHWPTPERGS